MGKCNSRSAWSNRVTKALYKNIGTLWRSVNGLETVGRYEEIHGAKEFGRKVSTAVRFLYYLDKYVPEYFRHFPLQTIVYALGFRWHVLVSMFRDLAQNMPHEPEKEVFWLDSLTREQESEMMRIYSPHIRDFIPSQHQAAHDRLLNPAISDKKYIRDAFCENGRILRDKSLLFLENMCSVFLHHVRRCHQC